MRTLFAAAVMVAGTIALSGAASAQGMDTRYPYCVRGKVGMFGSFDCTYTTIQQCRVSASPDGYCQRNPAYRGGAPRSYR